MSPGLAPPEFAVLDLVLERAGEFTSHFQPITGLRHQTVIGYEALLRPPLDLAPAGPAPLFDLALRAGRLVELELAAFDTHLREARGLRHGRLFLNLSAPAFLDERLSAGELAGRVYAAGFTPERIVLELTEIVRLSDPAAFARELEPVRREGFLIAVDDFGAGFSNLQLLVELGPDFVKIDRSLVSGSSLNGRKRVFLESIGVLGQRINCSVIAEGVETETDVETVRTAGIHLVQGWAIARPAPLAETLCFTPGPKGTSNPGPSPELTAGDLAVPQPPVAQSVPVAAVLPLFDVEPEPTAVPVLSGTRTVGLVTKHLLFFHLGHQFGYSLLRDRPVGRFLAEFGGGYDAIAASGSIEEAAEVVRRRPPGRRFDPVIVESEMGDYLGILPVDLLLAEMTRLKVDYALQSNPLTRLPGTQVLARTVDAWRARERPFCLGWADLDDFKPFNDRYGFARGDDVLLLAARTLRDRLVSSPDEVLAHPGGDDFAFVISPEAAEVLARRAAEEFSRDVLALYDEDDRRQGGIVSVDRRGERRTFGFVSISIGLVLWDGRAEVDTRRLVEVAAEVKTVAKGTPGPSVVLNRRAFGPVPASP